MDKERCSHSFIFTPGSWYGEGKIILNMIEEELIFNTNWAVQNRDFSGKVGAAQEIQIQGLSENMRNELTFYDFQPKTFCVDMENPNIGRITGTGLFDEKTIAWEFRSNDSNFEGYETYTMQPDGSYQMRGEYVTSDQFRTRIEARIWQGVNEVSRFDEEQEGETEEEP